MKGKNILSIYDTRRVLGGGGGGGGGAGGVRTDYLWNVTIEVVENPAKIQKTTNFITVVA